MNTADIASEHAARLAAADPLLPLSEALDDAGSTGDAPVFEVVKGDSGASGVSARTEVAPKLSDSLWRALVEHRLTVRLAGSQSGEVFADLLTRWDEHLAKVAAPGDWDTAAVVIRPSRDPIGSAELLRHGFAPVRVLAVRPADRLAAPGPAAEPGVRIRPAEQADLDTAVGLHTELLRYDAEFGGATLRESARELFAADVAKQIASSSPALWIAELYGQPLGLLQIQVPPDSGWARQYVRAQRVGYLSSLHVAEAARSSGVGSALAAHAHQLFDEAGMEVVLLHHALANPRSTPFWYSQGYRPLWTHWQRRPAIR
ncbi:MAG TPA: GNAT family N-acetyltransferase [Amycolatopsis sp.]|uniref:GNAT family N-acetyltransferase n=1 Tax=Amycolatopsis sp. TaxID=37632 RepID=UPI002B48E920|nr:GNAT family N-acetyltransferase [Amycolatopsis sp.]HKS49683.1 GNAT family N-acetyltransferase [Amycolatopsis sp.]